MLELTCIAYALLFSRRSGFDCLTRIWAKKNIFSDEAHFDVGGHANKQNCRIWHSGAKNWTDRVVYCMASRGSRTYSLIHNQKIFGKPCVKQTIKAHTNTLISFSAVAFKKPLRNLIRNNRKKGFVFNTREREREREDGKRWKGGEYEKYLNTKL